MSAASSTWRGSGARATSSTAPAARAKSGPSRPSGAAAAREGAAEAGLGTGGARARGRAAAPAASGVALVDGAVAVVVEAVAGLGARPGAADARAKPRVALNHRQAVNVEIGKPAQICKNLTGQIADNAAQVPDISVSV